MNKKAQFGIFQWMIVAFLTVVLFSGLIFVMGMLNNTFNQIGVNNDINSNSSCNAYDQPTCLVNNNSCTWNNNECVQYYYVNMTSASNATFGQVNSSIQALRMVAIVYILGEAVVFLLSNAFMKTSRLFFFAYCLIILLAVLFAPAISNSYLNLLNSGVFGGQLPTFTASNFILLNLPTIVMVLGFLGAIFMFVRWMTDSYDGGSL